MRAVRCVWLTNSYFFLIVSENCPLEPLKSRLREASSFSCCCSRTVCVGCSGDATRIYFLGHRVTGKSARGQILYDHGQSKEFASHFLGWEGGGLEHPPPGRAARGCTMLKRPRKPSQSALRGPSRCRRRRRVTTDIIMPRIRMHIMAFSRGLRGTRAQS